jgi:hypothetical protein
MIDSKVLKEAFDLLPEKMLGSSAVQMLLSIQLQEDRQLRRRQWPKGPARGAWQFEKAGGVRGVLNHDKTAAIARDVCAARGVAATEQQVWEALEHDDVLACCFARLLLWTDAKALPLLGDQEAGWACYLRTWRPGKSRPEEWPDNYQEALASVMKV